MLGMEYNPIYGLDPIATSPLSLVYSFVVCRLLFDTTDGSTIYCGKIIGEKGVILQLGDEKK